MSCNANKKHSAVISKKCLFLSYENKSCPLRRWVEKPILKYFPAQIGIFQLCIFPTREFSDEAAWEKRVVYHDKPKQSLDKMTNKYFLFV
jgi:hypothetical protein